MSSASVVLGVAHGISPVTETWVTIDKERVVHGFFLSDAVCGGLFAGVAGTCKNGPGSVDM